MLNETKQTPTPLCHKPYFSSADSSLRLISTILSELGFKFRHLKESSSQSLYAVIGNGHPHVLFIANLSVPQSCNIPCDVEFSAKHTALMCFFNACERLLKTQTIRGQISILIQNNDNRKVSSNLTNIFKKIRLTSKDIDFCIIGEPNQASYTGQEINIGNLGEILFTITALKPLAEDARQATNVVQNLLNLLYKLKSNLLDNGNEIYSSSTINILQLNATHPYPLQSPDKASAIVHVRYNNRHTPQDIINWMQNNINFSNGRFELNSQILSAPYVSDISAVTDLLKQSAAASGRHPHYHTNCTSEFSDFIKNYCPFAELGLALGNHNNTKENIVNLQEIYWRFLTRYLSGNIS